MLIEVTRGILNISGRCITKLTYFNDKRIHCWTTLVPKKGEEGGRSRISLEKVGVVVVKIFIWNKKFSVKSKSLFDSSSLSLMTVKTTCAEPLLGQDMWHLPSRHGPELGALRPSGWVDTVSFYRDCDGLQGTLGRRWRGLGDKISES